MDRLRPINSTLLVVLSSLALSGCSGCGGGGGSDSPIVAEEAEPILPIASFSASPKLGLAPLDVQFTNVSFLRGEEFPTFTWIFGDGGSSTERSPLHTYQLAGVYTVTLIVSTSTGTDLETKIDLIEVFLAGLPPVPDFTGTPREGEPRLAVQFTNRTDLVGAGFAEYLWDFGDGSIGTTENPSHVYVDIGTYTVSLTATSAGGTATETKIDYIEVLVPVPPPIADFSIDPIVGVVDSEVRFTNLSDLQGAKSAEYFWEFGDGQTSTERDPVHIYTEQGRFAVSLIATTRGGMDVAVQEYLVVVSVGPQVYITTFEQQEAFFPSLSLSLFVSSPGSNVRVRIPGLGFDETFPMTAEESVEIPIPLDAMIMGSDIIEPLGIEIASDNLVSVYGLNRQRVTTDMFAALPVSALGTEYYLMSHIVSLRSDWGGQFAIAAVADNTIITIVPTASTGTRVAGEAYEIQLNRLEVYQLQTDENLEDLTGTHILSNNPVAVFGGNICAFLPEGTGTCDHLVEQIPPVNTWGTEFITVPLATRLGGDTFRILAARDDTTVNIDGLLPDTIRLNSGEFAERILKGINVITSDKTVLVAQYANTESFDGVTGDPFMMIVMPAERFLSDYIFPTPEIISEEAERKYFVNVVAPIADVIVGQVLLDGAPLAPELFVEVPGTQFSAAQVPIEVGSHTLHGPNPLGAYIYGFGTTESYGFPGGMAF